MDSMSPKKRRTEITGFGGEALGPIGKHDCFDPKQLVIHQQHFEEQTSSYIIITFSFFHLRC
jgi:hypothetical protein